MDSGGGREEQAAQTLVEAALEVLNTPDPVEKARLGDAIASRWLEGDIARPYHPGDAPAVPDRPARLSDVKLVAPQQMPKLGKGGSLRSRQAILHSLVHTESWAIDLSWDIIARFGAQESMPRDFFTDFVKVAQDEGRHFMLLAARLHELDSFYGAFPAHDGLWDSAISTARDLLARIAIEHCVHEARGLDVLPGIIARFRKEGDECTAKLLETVVYPEEVTHCAAGVKWFRYLCLRNQERYHSGSGSSESPIVEEANVAKEQEVGKGDGDSEEPLECAFESLGMETGGTKDMRVTQTFHSTVRKYFRGPLKPPFNVQAREAAGFLPEWYEPLAIKG